MEWPKDFISILEALTSVIKASTIPFIFILFFFKNKWLIDYLTSKNLKLKIFDTEIQAISYEKIKDEAESIQREIEKLPSKRIFVGPIPYVSFEGNDQLAERLIALKEVGLELEKISNPYLFILLGGYYYYKLEYSSTIKNYQKAIDLTDNKEKNFSDLYCALGWPHLRLNSLDEAHACFSKALVYDQRNAWAYLGNAFVDFKQDNIKSANESLSLSIYEFTGKIENSNYDYTSQVGIARAYKLQHEREVQSGKSDGLFLDKSIEHLNQAIKSNRKIAFAYYNKACALLAYPENKQTLEKISEAAICLCQAIFRNRYYRQWALNDKSLEILINHPCYKCIIRDDHMPLIEKRNYFNMNDEECSKCHF